MAFIDRIYTDCPFYGSRKIKHALAREYDIWIGREQVQRLMGLMGIEGIRPKTKRNLSQSHPSHIKYPYLLKNLVITHPNHVWGTDITYIKLTTGVAYLIALLDWYSRYVIAWKLSSSLALPFCLDMLNTALTTAKPEICNSDQGSHFTSKEFTDILKSHGIAISMDGKGRCMDNIFTERLWRTIKYENVYMRSYATIKEATAGIGDYLNFYNTKRGHQALAYKTPHEVYFQQGNDKLITNHFSI